MGARTETTEALIESLYAAALDADAGEFARAGLRRLAEAVPYGLAVWDTREAEGAVVARRFARGQPMEEALTADALAADPESASRARVSLGGGSGLTHTFSYARDDHQPFEALEKTALAVLSRHLVAAEALCHRSAMRFSQLQSSDRDEDNMGMAVVNPQGRVLSADDRFVRQVRTVLRAWKAERLPFEFKWTPQLAAKGIAWRGLFVRVAQSGEQFHLRLRKDRRASKITDRERAVAEMAGEGKTFQEIGRTLKLAPSTASTHLYNLYAKIGIKDKDGLRDWLATQPEYSADAAPEPAAVPVAKKWLQKELARSFRLIPAKKS